MRRFAWNVFLASLAIALATCASISFFTTVMVPLSPIRTQAVLLHFYQGRFRVFWIESAQDPTSVSLSWTGPDLRIEPYYDTPPLPEGLVGADIPRNVWVRNIPIGGYRTISSWGGAWRTPMRRTFGSELPAYCSYIRLPAWLPTILLLYSPLRAIIRGIRERYRKRHNLCENCGYHLFALTIPRCPECGIQIKGLSA